MATSSKKGVNAVLHWYGFDELLTKIDELQGNMKESIKIAIEKSAEPVKKDIRDFIDKHSPPQGSPWATGETRESWKEQLEVKGDIITYKVGYDLKKSLAPVFLEYGGMHNPPYYFMNDAIMNNATEIERIQRETLEDILKELKR